VCIGIDVGGTFTDAVLTDGDRVWRAKSPTTKGDLGQGVLSACRLAAERSGTTLEELLPRVNRFGLGTTAVTNVLATGSGAPIGLITTRGFEDMVPLAKGRSILDDGWVVRPPPIVERELVIGVDERVDHNGQVLTTLDPAVVVAAARRLVSEGRSRPSPSRSSGRSRTRATRRSRWPPSTRRCPISRCSRGRRSTR
jgi:N-methylhydantoinase A